MALEDSRDLSGPQLRYSRLDDAAAADTLAQALELARQIEDLLEDTRSVVAPADARRAQAAGSVVSSAGSSPTRSTRMARAMAASLVDELAILVRPARSTGVA